MALTIAQRGGSVGLNSSGHFAKWISTSIMLPPASSIAFQQVYLNKFRTKDCGQ